MSNEILEEISKSIIETGEIDTIIDLIHTKQDMYELIEYLTQIATGTNNSKLRIYNNLQFAKSKIALFKYSKLKFG
jgi:hypothetical protein